jgi:hypothetical protein
MPTLLSVNAKVGSTSWQAVYAVKERHIERVSTSGGASRPAEYVALEAYTYVLVCGHDSQPLVAPFEDVTSCIEKARRFSSS